MEILITYHFLNANFSMRNLNYLGDPNLKLTIFLFKDNVFLMYILRIMIKNYEFKLSANIPLIR